MIPPNTMCRPPKPAARHQFPQAGGPSSAAAPTIMKHSPITGTTRTENAPPVTNPGPYSRSHVPGSACHTLARYSTTVNRPPTAIGARKLSQKRRPGPERIGSSTAYALRSEEHTSELQSQSNLVCRLLLEKKKKNKRLRHVDHKRVS